MLLLLFSSMFILILLGMDIAYVLLLSSIIVIGMSHFIDDFSIPLEVIPQYLFGGVDSFYLTAIPLFILAGEIMNKGGITLKLVEFVKKLIGHIRGGLAQTSVGINVIMAGISGSAVADCTATGSVLIPAMKKDGYSPEKSAAIIACASTIGPVIPPSIPLIIIGSIASISVGQLFLAGIIPGLLMALALMIYIWIYAKKNGIKKLEKASFKERIIATKTALLPLGMPVIIIGSIAFGIASPTESAVMGVLYSFIVTGLVYKSLDLRSIYATFLNSVVSSGVIMITVATGILFGWVATYHHLGTIVGGILLTVSDNPIVILIIINILLLVLGMVLETIPIILLMGPILFPIAMGLGIDPVHLGIVITVNLMIGLVTPPIGLHLFITSSIAKIPIISVIRTSFPLFIVLLIVLILITLFPQISLFIPNLIYK